MSGPESLTPADELAILGRTPGRDLRLHPVPDDTARTGAEVLPTVEKVLGRRPRRFTEWAGAHVAAFSR
ncbi:hypothetical protein [Streptomyces sp. NPDC001492]